MGLSRAAATSPGRLRLVLAASALVLLFAGLGRLPLLDPDEGRYARTAQEMLERGDLVVPVLDGEIRLQKPVLFYWLEAACFTLIEESETAARLPSALAAAGTLLWLYAFARRRAGETTALLACAVLMTTPIFFAMARVATTDMVLTFFVFGASASLYAGVIEPVRGRGHLWIAGICLGLGMLTKGPVALLVPLLVVAAGAVARRRAPITVAGRLVGVSWVMVAVALPWAALLFHRVGWETALDIWRREAIERLTSGLDHPESPLYFLMTAPVTFFPWSAFVPWALVSGVRRSRRGDAWWPALLAWTIGPFLFWTLSRGKLDSYLLPLAPAVALMVASSLATTGSRRAEAVSGIRHGVALPAGTPGAPDAPGAGPKPPAAGDGGRRAASPGLRWAIWLLVATATLALLPFPITRMTRSAPGALPLVALVASIAALTLGGSARALRRRAHGDPGPSTGRHGSVSPGSARPVGADEAAAGSEPGPGREAPIMAAVDSPASISTIAAGALASVSGALLLAGVLLLPLTMAEARSTRALVAGAGTIPRDEPIYTHRLLAPSLGFYTGRVPVAVPARYLLIGMLGGSGPATVVFEERRERVARELLAAGFTVRSRSGERLLMRRGDGVPWSAPGGAKAVAPAGVATRHPAERRRPSAPQGRVPPDATGAAPLGRMPRCSAGAAAGG
jgi:4-amino-4-deoxy-L-arabinose transferase-like glycosyltransferase